jgi:uncharacterized protein (DUF1684 family)
VHPSASPTAAGPIADLWDWRRRIADLYGEIRRADDPERAWHHWRTTRDALFQCHPQTPFDQASDNTGPEVGYFDYDPQARLAVDLEPADEQPGMELPAGADGFVALTAFAQTRGLERHYGGELTLYWIGGYGGGVFLPFKDATSGRTSYGGGRYLLDTIKGADLGTEPDGRIVLDFNFAYYPSCAYSPSWVCPLAPAANTLPVAVRAGECDLRS